MNSDVGRVMIGKFGQIPVNADETAGHRQTGRGVSVRFRKLGTDSEHDIGCSYELLHFAKLQRSPQVRGMALGNDTLTGRSRHNITIDRLDQLADLLARPPRAAAGSNEQLPADMSSASLIGGGLIAGESLYALGAGIISLLSLLH